MAANWNKSLTTRENASTEIASSGSSYFLTFANRWGRRKHHTSLSVHFLFPLPNRMNILTLDGKSNVTFLPHADNVTQVVRSITLHTQAPLFFCRYPHHTEIHFLRGRGSFFPDSRPTNTDRINCAPRGAKKSQQTCAVSMYQTKRGENTKLTTVKFCPIFQHIERWWKMGELAYSVKRVSLHFL